MAELATLAIKDIFIPERLRAVEEDHALAISTDMVAHGQITPVMVRRTPNGQAKYTLVAGAHRMRALELIDETHVDAVIAQADKAEAQLLEISENLFRNELSVIDRAVFVQTYRDLWEQKYGKIQRGGDQIAKAKNYPLLDPALSGAHQNPIDILTAEASEGFSAHIAKRLGVSKAAVKRLTSISRMQRSLREELRGRPEADKEGVLYRLAGLEPVRQAECAAALKLTHGDLGKALAAVMPVKSKPTKQQKALNALTGAWVRASKETRAQFLAEIGAVYAKSGEPS